MGAIARGSYAEAARTKCYDNNFDYTTHVNNWLHRNAYVAQREEYKEQRYERGASSIWECSRAIIFQHGVLKSYGWGHSKKEARNRADHGIHEEALGGNVKCKINRLNNGIGRTQMDGEVSKESNQGIAAQVSSKESNTIITRDEGETETNNEDHQNVSAYISAERVFEFPHLIDRWMPLDTIEVTTEMVQGQMVKTYYLPETLFRSATCAPNLVPFEAFIYSQLDVDMRFVVNAQKFQCGKVVASVKFDTFQADQMQITAMAALNRPHVILDLSSNNQGVLHVPFRYHRGFVRNVKNDANSAGIRPSKFASVYVQILSPLRSGPDSATNMFITPFYKFTRCRFAAMSYKATVQMDLANDVINTAYKASGLKQILTKYENMALQFGNNNNRDKPVDYDSTIIIPRPRMNFGTGKGLSDAQPLKNNPLSLTSAQWIKPFEDEPQTTTQIARIWGLRDSFKWKAGNDPNDELWKAIVDPCSRSYTQEYIGTPTPVEYVCGMYSFWSGALEFRFDFVSNSFHTGAVMISIEFGRPLIVNADACSKASTYTKTFHLGDQKSVTVTVPYIYDTGLRRTTSSVYNPNFSRDTTDVPTDRTRAQAMGVRAESKTIIRVSVVNDLRPIQTTTQEIDVLVFMRAGPTFVPHGLKQMSYVLTRESSGTDPYIDSFPRDNYAPVTPTSRIRRPRDVTSLIREATQGLTPAETAKKTVSIAHKYLPPEISNEWNETSSTHLGKIPRTQADEGFKEDEDSTQDFSIGRTLLKLQTSDVQTSIKDILRRPVLMVYRHLVASNLEKGEQFFLPIMPPSREFNYHVNQGDAFSDLVGQTPQAAIMNLFRFWRGSSRYTIFIHSGSPEPVYVTYVPHSGTRIIGNQVIGNDLPQGKERPIMGCGLTTEPILPTVNPSAVVEVPYDTENFWTLTFEEDTQRNYAWRDKGDTNAGHIAITATVNIQVSIWWSAGDDFEVANFYGIPECRNKDALMQYADAYGRTQMDQDFCIEERRTVSSTLKQVKNEVLKLTDARVLTKALIGSVPLVGPAAVLAPTVAAAENVIERSDKAMGQLNVTLNSIDGTAKALTEVSKQLIPTINTVREILTKVASPITNLAVWSERITDFLVDLCLAWYQKSWVQVGVSCFKMFAKILAINVSSISDYLKEFVGALSSVTVARVQAPSETSTIIGALAGIIGVAFGAKICQDRYSSYSATLSRTLLQTSGISYINQVIRFVQTTFDIIRDMVMEALGYKSPEAVALKMLSGKDLILKNFITNGQNVINEANSTLVLHPRFRVRFWYTVTQAYQIQQVLSMVPSNIVSPQLSKLCSEVIKVGNERMMDLSCSPVRYEPFVICIEGSEGVGKSHLTDKLVSHLLKAVDFTRASSGWTYTRAPGSKHWSGYRDQPAIIYDDWLNLNDAQLMSQQISELYQLKSTSTFIPEMAHLEEKRIKANPMLVVLLTNGAFPTAMSNVAHHPSAVLRRRDIVIQARMKTEYAGTNPRDLVGDDSLNCVHLEFRKYGNSGDRNSLSETPRNWNDTIKYLAEVFQRYHAQEEVNVRTRVDILREQLQIGAEECFDFEDPFSLLYKSTDFISQPSMGSNAWLPSEQLETAVVEIVENIQRKKLQRIPIIIPPEPADIFTQYDCCPTSWSELAQWFVRGAFVTPEVWTRILKWSADGLVNVLSTISDWSHQEHIGECVVCNEVKSLLYACDNGHRTCADCWQRVRLYSPNVSCPVCRSTEVGISLDPKSGVIATVLIWLSSLTEDVLLPTIKFVVGIIGKCSSRALSKILLLGELIIGSVSPLGVNTRQVASHLGRVITSEVLDPSETFYDALSEIGTTMRDQPISTAVYGIAMPIMSNNNHIREHQDAGQWTSWQRRPLNQADDEWDLPVIRDVQDQRPQDPVTICQLNEVGFQASRTPKTTLLPQCYHSHLKENIDTIIYRDSQIVGPAWQMPMEVNGRLEHILVLDNPCQHNCVWERENVHRDFCETFIQRRQAQISRAQIQYVGTLQSNPLEFLKGIPRFARPMWAQTPTMEVELRPDNWWNFLSETWESYRDIIVVSGAIAGTLGAVYLGYSTISTWLSSSEVPRRQVADVNYWPINQSDPNYNPEHSRFIQRAARNIRPLRQVRTQGDQLSDVVEGYICKNYVRIIVCNDSKMRYLTAIGLYNHYAAIPRHYVKVLEDAKKEGKTIQLAQAAMEWAGSKYTRQDYNFDIGDFIISPISDIAFMKLPASFKMFKDIRKFLTTQNDLNNYISSEGKIVLAPTRDNQIPQVVPIQVLGYQESAIFEDVNQGEFEAFHVLNYTFSKQGACGSVICVENHQRPIVAMHCAGQGDGIYGVGWGVLLTQECVQQILPDNIVTQCEEVEHDSLEKAQFIFDDEIQLDYIGTVPPHLQPHIPQKSKIEKSLLHNRFGFKSLTEPTILTPRDPRYTHERSPLYYGVEKHGKKTKDFTSAQIHRAMNALWDKWLSKMKPAVVSPKRLTYEQAVLGFEGNKYYEALSLNTSAGYPWNLGGNTTKEQWINVDWNTRTCEISSKLLEELQRKERLRNQGIVPETIFVDTLKDERKKSEKISKQGATRVFCASPVDYTIALRQNLLHFCAAYMKDRHNQMHAVGIDVHGEEWARLRARLSKHGREYVGLDYSNFGPGFNACVANAASQLMNRWTLENCSADKGKYEWQRELDALGWECDNSMHLCGNTLYRQTCGSPSGAAITVIKNSLVNILYILCAWEALAGKLAKVENLDIWEEFRLNVELCVYGDDLVMTVNEKYRNVFNMITIQDWFKLYGIVSTDAQKTGNVQKFVDANEITFLKRGWTRHPTRAYQYLAPLDITSINDITQWVWRSADKRMATRVNCESALLEAHGLGIQMYELLRKKINDGLAKLGIPGISMTWYDVDQKYFEEEEMTLGQALWG